MHISGKPRFSVDGKTRISESSQNAEKSNEGSEGSNIISFDKLGPLFKKSDFATRSQDQKGSKDASFITQSEGQNPNIGPKLERGAENKQIQVDPDAVVDPEISPSRIRIVVPTKGRRGSDGHATLGKFIKFGLRRKNSQEIITEHAKEMHEVRRQTSLNSISNIDYDAELKDGKMKLSHIQTKQLPKFLPNMISMTHVPDFNTDRKMDTRTFEGTTKTMKSLTENIDSQHKPNPFEKAKSRKDPLENLDIVLQDNQRMGTERHIKSVVVDSRYFDNDNEHKQDAKLQNRAPSESFILKDFFSKVSHNILLTLVIISVLGLLYVGIPFILLFGAHDYTRDGILANLNFGLLGFFQGLTEAAFLYELIDKPIRKKIRELEGEGNRLIDINDYIVINVPSLIIILLFSAGTQILAGNALRILDLNTGPTGILLTCFTTTLLKGFIITLIVMFTTPKSIFDDKDLIKKELKQISKIRQEFMEDLKNMRISLQMAELQEIYGDNELHGTMIKIAKPIEIKNTSNFDLRKFSQGCEDFGREFRKVRLKSIRVFGMLSIAYLHILTLYYLDKAIGGISIVPLSLLLAVVFPLVSFVFGLFDFFNRTTSFHLKSMKATHVIIMVAMYRILYLQIKSRGEMVGILCFKILYKVVVYFGGTIFGSRAMNFLKSKLKLHRYGSSEVEAEFTNTKISRYTFDKFLVLQQADLLFAIGTLLPIACSQGLLPDLHFDIHLKCKDIIFYVALVSAEIFVDLALTGMFLCFKRRFSINRNTKSGGTLAAIVGVFQNKKYTIMSSELMIMFLVLFMLLNLV